MSNQNTSLTSSGKEVMRHFFIVLIFIAITVQVINLLLKLQSDREKLIQIVSIAMTSKIQLAQKKKRKMFQTKVKKFRIEQLKSFHFFIIRVTDFN